jgi:DNA-binding NarL/FixJ family response regulator
MLTVSRDDDDLFDALRAGAHGYLLKDIERRKLPEALRSVLDGEAQLPASLVARVLDEFRARQSHKRAVLRDRPDVELRRREWEVLELMRLGLSTEQIGERLFITPVTVRTHVSAILKKLHVANRDEAVRLLDR